MDLSVIIPTYNEAPNIRRSAGGVIEYLSARDWSWELLLVDDGSTDDTLAIEQEIAAADERVRVLPCSPNHGKGYVVREGMLAAQGDVRLFLDADYSTPIEEYDKFLPRFADGADVVIGSRRMADRQIETKPPLHRHLMGEAYIKTASWLLGTRLSDFNCGFKAFRAEVAECVFGLCRRSDWSYDAEVLALAAQRGYRIDEVSVRWAHVQATSKVHPVRDAIRSFLSLLAIRRDLKRGVYEEET